MKWLIGPRRIGRTTKLIMEFLEYPGSAVLYSYNKEVLEKVHIPTILKYDSAITIKNYSFQYGGYHKILCTYVQDINNLDLSNSAILNLPKFLDDVDSMLKTQFGNISIASGTGPNYRWPYVLSKEILEEMKGRVAPEDFQNEFTLEWK